MIFILFYISWVHLLCPSIHIPSSASEATQGDEFHVRFIILYTSLPLHFAYSKGYLTWLLTFSTMIRVHAHQVSVSSLRHFQPQVLFWVLHLLPIINIEYMTLSTLCASFSPLKPSSFSDLTYIGAFLVGWGSRDKSAFFPGVLISSRHYTGRFLP